MQEGSNINHSSACATAKTPVSQCECSCGGSRHAAGDQTSKNSTTSSGGSSGNVSSSPSDVVGSLQDYNPELSDGGKTIVKGAIIGGTLATHPELTPAYKAYKTYDVSKKIYNASDDPEKLKNTLSKQGASRAGKSLSKEDASQIAKDVRNAFENSGGTENLLGDAGSNINDRIYATMLEGSIEGGLTSSAGEMAKYTVEGAI